MYLNRLFAPSGLLIVRMRQPPGFRILVAALEIIGILTPPRPVSHSFALFLTRSRPAALLALAQPPVRHEIPPARHTPLSMKQFKLSHETSLTERYQCRISVRLNPSRINSSNQKKLETPAHFPAALTAHIGTLSFRRGHKFPLFFSKTQLIILSLFKFFLIVFHLIF